MTPDKTPPPTVDEWTIEVCPDCASMNGHRIFIAPGEPALWRCDDCRKNPTRDEHLDGFPDGPRKVRVVSASPETPTEATRVERAAEWLFARIMRERERDHTWPPRAELIDNWRKEARDFLAAVEPAPTETAEARG